MIGSTNATIVVQMSVKIILSASMMILILHHTACAFVTIVRQTMIKDIHKALVNAGVPVDHHQGDLYCKATPQALLLLHGYKWQANITRFRSAIDGSHWIDIPFAYTPFYEKKGMRA